MTKFNKIAIYFLVLLWSGLFSFIAYAKMDVSITPVQTLTFPLLALPGAGGSVYLNVSPLNSSTSGTAQIISGTASRGQYNVSLDPGGKPVSISIDITGANAGHSGLTLSNFQGFYQGQVISSFPSSTLPLPEKSPRSTPLYIGARITANSTVPPGSYTGHFTITIFVQ